MGGREAPPPPGAAASFWSPLPWGLLGSLQSPELSACWAGGGGAQKPVPPQRGLCWRKQPPSSCFRFSEPPSFCPSWEKRSWLESRHCWGRRGVGMRRTLVLRFAQ